ncbi:OB-fold domain-containing protein [Microbacterium sp. No. 7]|uniref:OB-fold domain-containing protein n=1 Tax=Microbacterium sp. No. 7 TaxID=1714373 RepID=UPI0006D139A4|nr:OB-fold domain-containing protein [Microbacterium sp. No. 7]
MPIFPIVRDDATSTFLDGCERGELLIVQNTQTGEHLDAQTDVTADPEHLRYVPASGEGTVVSWSIGHNRGPDGSPTQVLFGIVQLAEGPWLWAELLTDRVPEQLTGAAAHVTFLRTGPEPEHATVPAFTIT